MSWLMGERTIFPGQGVDRRWRNEFALNYSAVRKEGRRHCPSPTAPVVYVTPTPLFVRLQREKGCTLDEQTGRWKHISTQQCRMYACAT